VLPAPSLVDQLATVLEHYRDMLSHYGTQAGMRIARKHIGWYTRGLPGGEAFRREAVQILTAPAQLAAVARYYDGLMYIDAGVDPA
jgi:tRNA-dihydrouridine synthase B